MLIENPMQAFPRKHISAADLPRAGQRHGTLSFQHPNGLGFTADDEGKDLSSPDEAREEAIRGARSLMSAEVLEGMLDLNGQIEVTDDHQARVLTVRFVEAVDVHPAEQSGSANQ